MSLTPAFEIGLWNAWIFMLCLALQNLLPRPIAGKDGFKRLGEAADTQTAKAGKRISTLNMVIYILLTIYSIFLPLKLGTLWFYTGLPIGILGLILSTVAIASIANIPLDKPFTKGLYRYSRHPMYVTYALTLIGVGIASASWIFLVFSFVSTALLFIQATYEERFCLDKDGIAYREYMNRTPRYIGIPK